MYLYKPNFSSTPFPILFALLDVSKEVVEIALEMIHEMKKSKVQLEIAQELEQVSKKVKLDTKDSSLLKDLGFCNHYVVSHSPITKGIIIDGPETSRHSGIFLDDKVGLSGDPLDDVVPTLQWTFAINLSKGQFVQELLNGCRWQD